jgi:hypothetical protein
VVEGNMVKESRKDGYLVEEKEVHGILRRNLAIGAGDDGFDVESSSTKLSLDEALRNADWGIEAVRGVADGGGNIASRNGRPRQCTNIVCG